MFKLLSKILRLDDFEQIKHAIVLKNDTSGTEILNPDLITIGEIKLTGICLELPVNSVGNNHSLTLFIYNSPVTADVRKNIKSKKFRGSLQVIGKVKHVENEEETQCIEIEFTQFDPKQWKAFYNKYTQAQDSIQNYINSGEEN